MVGVTVEDVRKLRAEAAEAGDDAQVAVCDRAIAGDVVAWSRCCRVVVEAREALDFDGPLMRGAR